MINNISYIRLSLYIVLMSAMTVGSFGCARAKKQNQAAPSYLKKYLFTEVVAPLKIPTGMDARERVNQYPVPGENLDLQWSKQAIAMPEELINPATGNIRIQSMADYSWLLADISVAQTWPRLRGFIGSSLLPVENIDVQKGEIITKWLVPEGDLPREKYRIWLEAGLRPNTSEVHLLQATETYLKEHKNRWPTISVNTERAHIMLESIAGYILDLQHEPIAISSVVTQFKQKSRMQVRSSELGLSELTLDLKFDRAWAALSLALKKSDILVVDLNRDAGIYYIAYQPSLAANNPKRKKRAKKKARLQQKQEQEQNKTGEGAANQDPGLAEGHKRRDAPATAAIDKIAKDLPKARLLVSTEKQQIVIRIDTDFQKEDEATIAELNIVMKKIAIYIS